VIGTVAVVREVRETGARAYVLKSEAGRERVTAVETVHTLVFLRLQDIPVGLTLRWWR
jgi:hypothetical protein